MKSGKNKLLNKYRTLWIKGRTIELLTRELSESYSVLKIRNRSEYQGTVLFSDIMKELSEQNYKFQQIDCMFCRSHSYADESIADSLDSYDLYADIDECEKTRLKNQKREPMEPNLLILF